MYHLVGFNHQVTISKPWLILIIVLAVWETVWRLIAFWKAAKNNQLAWFIVMAIINTAGLLEIAYIVFFQKKPPKKHQQE